MYKIIYIKPRKNLIKIIRNILHPMKNQLEIYMDYIQEELRSNTNLSIKY